MERCPTCGARFRGEPVCSRCGTDLEEVLNIEQAALYCRQQAFAALQDGLPEAAYGHAHRACVLHRSSDSVQALALSAMACQKFAEAVALWHEYRRCIQTQEQVA